MSFRRFKSLLFKSAQIEEQIEREQKRAWPDWIKLLKLKKLRLLIKDRIQKIVLERQNRDRKAVPVRTMRAHRSSYPQNQH